MAPPSLGATMSLSSKGGSWQPLPHLPSQYWVGGIGVPSPFPSWALWFLSHNHHLPSPVGCGCFSVAQLRWQIAQLRSLPFFGTSTPLFSVVMETLPLPMEAVTAMRMVATVVMMVNSGPDLVPGVRPHRGPDEDGEEEAGPGPRQAHDSLYRVHMPSLYSCGSSYGSEASIPAAAHTVSNAPVTEYM